MTADAPITTRHERFEDFYRTHRETVARALAVAIRDPEGAAWATDEAMAEAAAAWRRLRQDASQAPTLFNGALELALVTADTGTTAERREARSRALVTLRYLLDWSDEDLAIATGLTSTAVRERLARLSSVNGSDRSEAKVKRAIGALAASMRPPAGNLTVIAVEGRSRRIRRFAQRATAVTAAVLITVLAAMVLTANRSRVSTDFDLEAPIIWERGGITIRDVPTGSSPGWGVRTRLGLTVLVDRAERGLVGKLVRVLGRDSDVDIYSSVDGVTWEARKIRDGVLRGVHISDVAESAGVITLLGVDSTTDSGAEIILRSGDLERWDRIDLVIPREGTPLPSGMIWAYDTELMAAGAEVAVRVSAVPARDFGTDDPAIGAEPTDPSIGPAPVTRFYTYVEGEWTELDRSGIEDWNQVTGLWLAGDRWFAVALDGEGTAVMYHLTSAGFQPIRAVPADAAAWTDEGLLTHADGTLGLYDFEGAQRSGIGLDLGSTPSIITSGEAAILTTPTELAIVDGNAVRRAAVADLRPQDRAVPKGSETIVIPASVLGDTMLGHPSDALSTWWAIQWSDETAGGDAAGTDGDLDAG